MAQTRTFQGVTYMNGACPQSILAPLDGNNWGAAFLRKDAAASWNRARAEVLAKTGLVLTVRGWNRSLAEQVTFYLQRHARAGRGDRVCCYWNGVPYRFTAAAHAAPPGTSNHGWALAVDIVDFGVVGQWNNPRYLAAWPILAKHGWTEAEGRGSIQEPWHKVYDPSRDTQKNATPISTGGFMVDLTEKEQRELLDGVRELRAGTAPMVPISMAKTAETVTLRAALRDIRMRTGSTAALVAQIPQAAVDVDASELAEAFGELLKTLPAATAQAVLDLTAARLKS